MCKEHFPSLQEMLAAGPPKGSVPEEFRKSYMKKLSESDGSLDSLVLALESCAKEQWEREVARIAPSPKTGKLPG